MTARIGGPANHWPQHPLPERSDGDLEETKRDKSKLIGFKEVETTQRIDTFLNRNQGIQLPANCHRQKLIVSLLSTLMVITFYIVILGCRRDWDARH